MTHDHVINRIVDELDSGGITGWCEPQKALELASIVLALRPKVVVELGVWGGRSFLPMALTCESINAGVCFAVDPWSAPASVEGYDKPNADWWGQQDHNTIYQNFVAHVQRLGLQNRVAIERAKSDDAIVPSQIDLLHIDGQHHEQCIRDVRRWAANVRVGGVVCMDDIEWSTAGVQHVKQAVVELLSMGFVELHRTVSEKGSWGFFQRISSPAPAANSVATRPTRAGALVAPKRKAKKRR